MTTTWNRDDLVGYISDRYKELNGIRPRFNWDEWSTEELEAEADSLNAQIEYEIHRDRIEMEQALGAMLAYAPDFETAQRWAQEVA
jgi:hypothetical protein